jgi:tRNA(Met) C34 N-acetyltransferase TmcA
MDQLRQLDDAQTSLLVELLLGRPRNILIVAPAGKGKSYFLSIIRHVLIQRDGANSVLVTSMLKANAVKLSGTTFASAFKFPIQDKAIMQIYSELLDRNTPRYSIINSIVDNLKDTSKKAHIQINHQYILLDESSNKTRLEFWFQDEICR